MIKKLTPILVIGAGSIGMRHLKNLVSLGYNNLAVSDPDKKKLAAVRKIGNFNLYENVKTVFQKEKPKVVFICAPTHLHVPLANLALDYDADIFIEKPLSTTLAGTNSLIKKAKDNNRIAMVACNFLFYKGLQNLQKVVRKRIYGKPLLYRSANGFYMPLYRKNIHKSYIAKNQTGGGVILDHTSHPIYYLSTLFGNIQKIVSFVSKKHPLGFQSEEMALLMLEHKNGVIGSISSDYISKRTTHRIEVVTENGLLTLDLRSDRLVFEDRKIKKELYRGDKDFNKMFIEEIKYFLNCVKRRAKPFYGLPEGRDTLKTLIQRRQL